MDFINDKIGIHQAIQGDLFTIVHDIGGNNGSFPMSIVDELDPVYLISEGFGEMVDSRASQRGR
jgi:hypothetical protein